jgi:hypothetical protein
MSNESNSTEITEVSLESLRLRPGTAFQACLQAKGAPVCEVQLLGIVRGKSVMVGFKVDGGVKTTLVAGKDYLIRGFSGQHDFSFTAQAIQVFKSPVAYAMLAYPGIVEAKMVRKTIRTKVSLRATASLQGKNIPHAVTLMDLSVAGAKMDSQARIGPPGELVSLIFAVEIEKNKVELDLLSTIRYTTKSDSSDGYSIGVEFKDLTRDNQLVLHYLATQESASANNSDVVL